MSKPVDIPDTISGRLADKADRALLRVLGSPDFDRTRSLPTVVVLVAAPGAAASRSENRQAAVAEAAAAFERAVAPLLAALRATGATEAVPNWISRSVAVVAPLAALEAAAERTEVRQIVLDTPRPALA